jgi:6-phosphogluconolactonase/glucosamine-6-phosphate isomerase/deaminase
MMLRRSFVHYLCPEGAPSSITLTIESLKLARQVAVGVRGTSKGKNEAVKRYGSTGRGS